MTTFKFTILGNHEKPDGNPCPYVRVVGNALWLPHARRYAEWKKYVRKIFYESYPKMMLGRQENEKPLGTTDEERTRMDIKIFFVNRVHADEDNIFKGIADSLFENDKNLDGSFEADYDKKKPRVEVTITSQLRK